MSFRKILVALTAVILLGGITACSSESNNEPTRTAKTGHSTDAEPTGKAKTPSAKDLQKVLDRAVDGSIPVDQKLDTVQSGEEAPELFAKVTKIKKDNGVTFEVLGPVVPMGKDRVSAKLKLSTKTDELPAQDVTFVKEDGKWMVAKVWMCNWIGALLPDDVPAACEAA